MSESMFDAEKEYSVFKYIVDSVTGEPTEHAGEIVGFVSAVDPWQAVEKAGFDDMNAYGANRIDKLEDFEKAIANERKLLSKISKQLKVMTDRRDAERKKFLEEAPCPNCNIKMNEKHQCDKCGFGYEGRELIKEIENTIKEEKKKGNDTSQLESFLDTLKQSLED